MHWHNEFEINYILEGCSEFICGEEKFTAHSGDIIIAQPNVLHSIYPTDDAGQVYDTLVFSPDIFGSSETDRCYSECIRPLVNGSMRVTVHITPAHPHYAELQRITETIFHCAKGDSPQLDLLLRSELFRFLWFLEEDAQLRTETPEANEIIRPALEYIAENYNTQITIKQLADTVHLSQSYFMNQFQRYVGVSAALYISHFRINKACQALTGTKKTISEIAFDCGFHNLSNFNRQFLRIVGCPPREYRKKL
jgi:AraC-like DNA-binding protein